MTGVNMVFFISGPQLGESEAGAVANWLGATFSVVSGGVGCLVAARWVAPTTPALRRHHATKPMPVVEPVVSKGVNAVPDAVVDYANR